MKPTRHPLLSVEMTEQQSTELRVRAAQINQLYTQSRAGTVGALLSAVVLVLVLRDAVEYQRLLAWIGAYVVVQVIRQAVISAFLKASPRGLEAIPWGKWFTLSTILSGLLWGAAGVYLFPAGSLQHQFVLALFIAGIAAAGVVVYCPLKECYVPTIIAELTPVSLWYLVHGTQFHLTIGAVILLFCAVLVLTGRHMHALSTESLKLRFEKDELIQRLTTEKEKTEQLNRSLAIEAAEHSQAREALATAHDYLEKQVAERTSELQEANEKLTREIIERETLQQALRREKENLGLVLEAMDDGIRIVDSHMKVVYVNAALQRDFGPFSGSESDKYLQGLPMPLETGQMLRRDSEQPSRFEWCSIQTGKTYELSEITLKDVDGNLLKLETFRDITGQKMAEQSLRDSEERFRNLVANAGDIFVQMDLQGVVTLVNPVAAKITGYSEADLLGRNLMDLVHPSHREEVKGFYRRQLLKRIPDTYYEFPLIKKSGGIVWLGQKVQLIVQEHRRVGFQSICRDITRQKEAEEALRKSEERFRDLANLLPQFVYEVDKEGYLTFLNRVGLELSGYTLDDVRKGMRIGDFVASEDLPKFSENVAGVLKGERTVANEYLVQKKDGSRIPIVTYSNPIVQDGSIVGWRGVAVDISDRKQAEKALRESEERYRLLTENSLTGIYIHQDDHIVFVNDRLLQLSGYTYEDAVSRPFWHFVHPEDRQMVKERGRARAEGDRILPNYEFRLIAKDGSTVWVELLATTIIHNGRTANMGNVADITERKMAEKELRASEERHRDIIRYMEDGYFELDLAGNLTFFNEAASRIFGYPPDELLRMSHREFMWKDALEDVSNTFKAVLETGETKRLSGWGVVRKDGTRRILETPVSLIRDPEGRPIGFRGIARDVTESRLAAEALKKAHDELEKRVMERTNQLQIANEQLTVKLSEIVRMEHRLRESEARYRALLDALPDPVVAYDVHGRATYLNRSFTETYGWHSEDVLGKQIDFVPQEELEKTLIFLEQTFEGKNKSFETKRLTKAGDQMEVQLRMAVLYDNWGKHTESIVIHRDITERKRWEDRLTESEARYRTLFERAGDAIYVLEADGTGAGTLLSANSSAALLHGYGEGELVGLHITSLEAPEEVGRNRRRIDTVLRGEWLKEEILHRKKDGTVFPVEASASLLEVGNRRYILAIDRDVTERKAAENALKESERRYKDLFDNSADLIYTHDVHGNFLSVNQAVRKILGYQEEEFIGLNFRDILSEEFVPLAEESLRRKVELGEMTTGNYEVLAIAKDGHPAWLEVNSRRIDENGRIIGVHGTARDITDRHEAKQALEKALAMARQLQMDAELANSAKSQFLANMSHELRTPLNAIIGFAEVLEDKLFGEMNDTQLKYIGYVVSSGRHLLSLINDILDLARVESGKLELQLSDVNMNTLVSNSSMMIEERARRHKIKLELPATTDLSGLWVRVDELKLKQIMFNLLSNAVKFTPDAGSVKLDVILDTSHLFLTISDTGIGLEAADMRRIFEPFVQVDNSLSRLQQGTGLGLALTRRLVELHGGTVWAESEGLGLGARFVVKIPCSTTGIGVDPTASNTVSTTFRSESADMAHGQPDKAPVNVQGFENTHRAVSMSKRSELLMALRREMVRSRQLGVPLSVIGVTFEFPEAFPQEQSDRSKSTLFEEIAGKLKNLVRLFDTVGFLDPGKFVIVLPGCDRASSDSAVARIARYFEDHKADSREDGAVLTPEFGIAEADVLLETDPERIILQAFSKQFRVPGVRSIPEAGDLSATAIGPESE